MKSGKFVNIPKYLLTRLFSMLTFKQIIYCMKRKRNPILLDVILISNMNIIPRFVYLNYNQRMEN